MLQSHNQIYFQFCHVKMFLFKFFMNRFLWSKFYVNLLFCETQEGYSVLQEFHYFALFNWWFKRPVSWIRVQNTISKNFLGCIWDLNTKKIASLGSPYVSFRKSRAPSLSRPFCSVGIGSKNSGLPPYLSHSGRSFCYGSSWL